MRLGGAIAGEQAQNVFAVGEIEPAAAGEQEFAADRRHPIMDGDARAALHEDFRRHQSGGAAANDGDVEARG
jgi:hypothetical protein